MISDKAPEHTISRLLAIVTLVFAALAAFVGFDYQNTKEMFEIKTELEGMATSSSPLPEAIASSANDNRQIVTPVIIRGTVGLGLAGLLLVLAIGSRKKPPQIQNIKESELDLINDNLPFGVALWSGNGELVGCNTQYKDRLKLSCKDIVPGASYVDMMGRVKSSKGYKIVSDEELIRQLEITHDDESAIFIDERPIGENGFITLVTDISEKVKLEQELKKVKSEQRVLSRQLHEETIKAQAASRSKTSFLAHLSHDVRTPLNHIIGFADLIAHQTYGPIGDERYLNYINDIKTSGERLLRSFSEILELAQIEGGHLILRREKVELREMVSAIENRFKAKSERADVKLEIEALEEMSLHLDRMCIERMIGNIVENAIRFTPSGGKVKLSAWSADDGVVLEISDNGIGMSPERIADLSQPFVLGDAAFTREGGVGIGIAISRAIAELSGGRLEIDSSPAVGTTVAISLPLKAAEQSDITRAA